VRTVRAAGLTVEVFYPARPGSDAGAPRAEYDLRDALPPDLARAVRDDLPRLVCECARDLPLDDARGPYPVVAYLHGLSLYRFEHVSLAAHWASRGFVVVAPDLPGATFADVLAKRPRQDWAAAVLGLLGALDAPEGELAFLAGRIDPARVGLVGHSLGGDIAGLVARERGAVVIPMAEKGVPPAKRAYRTVVIGGLEDRIEPWKKQVAGYQKSPAPKQLVGIAGAGHMSFSDVCAVAAGEGGWHAAAVARGLRLGGFAAVLAEKGCKEPTVSAEVAGAVIRLVTTAALEGTLTCRAESDAALAAAGLGFAVYRAAFAPKN
jgi:predicted dienelactone hydrolase